ncbi:MAG TPA: c-type cytochrome [Acidiferrobacter sp.]|nr:c-type cytochrome [Acidiferrobacter sp.]
MKRFRGCMAVISILALPALASANGSPQTHAAMVNEGCFACHAVSHKLVGPAYSWVAYVFAHKPNAAVRLAHKIINGGGGRWDAWTGGIPMLPHPELTLAQAEQMADWVLAQKPVAPPTPCRGAARPVPIPGHAQPLTNIPCGGG